jgi:hypothetical protein
MVLKKRCHNRVVLAIVLFYEIVVEVWRTELLLARVNIATCAFDITAETLGGPFHDVGCH